MTTTKSPAPNPAGLADVVAGSTAKSKVDGVNGKLIYCGYPIEPLAEQGTFEETTYLLWNEELPNAKQLADFTKDLASQREVPAEVWNVLKPVAARGQSLMSMLRTGVSALSAYDPDVSATREINPERPKLERAISRRLLGWTATLVAGAYRMGKGQEPIAPRTDLSHAGNLLYMVNGEEPGDSEERIFDAALILHADHGFNASTFAARVTAATESDIYAAATSAIGTLAGRLHGGANERVFYMLEEIGSPDKVDAFVDKVFADPKGRIMGFGHRVYRVEDPRATVLRRMAEDLTSRTGNARWFELSQRIEEKVCASKPIYPNVDFYSASVYASLGLAPEIFTPIFAVSRMAGWLAHIMEQHADNRLIRPRSNWIGSDARAYSPVDKR